MTKARFPDPYDGMSDEELDRHFSELITENRQRQRAVSIRFPEDLLEQLQGLAAQFGVRYQTLIKLLLEQDVARLGSHPRLARRRQAPASAKRRSTATKSSAASTVASASSKSTGKKRTTRPRVPV